MRVFALAVCLMLVASACRSEGDDDDSPDGGSTDGSVSDGGESPDSTTPDASTNITPVPAPTITPGAANRFLIQGTLLTPTGPLQGELLVEGTMITCVAASCSGMAGATGATVIRTSGFVMPGMLDSHNHGLFNIFDEGDWTPTMFWGDHDDWTVPRNEPRYAQVLDAKQELERTLACEMDKYAEVKALISGTTSFLLAPGAIDRLCYASVVRTIDTRQNDLGQDKLRVSSISLPDNATAQTVCNQLADGTYDRYILHVAEGINPTALGEFDTLAGRAGGCLIQNKAVMVHATALDATRWQRAGQAGMKVVWSPASNMFLYNETTRIDLALANGVTTIALAPDWSLGGSVNLLDELRAADRVDTQKLGNILSPRRLFDMVTIDAANVLGVDALLGSLTVGKRADLVLVNAVPTDPYASLLTVRPQHIELVMVDGRALYGTPELMAAGPTAPGCEGVQICGVNKFLCIAETSTADKLNQTFATITSELSAALAAYDTTVASMGIAAMSPLAPLTKCP